MKKLNRTKRFVLLFLLFFVTLCNVNAQGANLSDFILIDQFGYRANAQKTAVIKNPQLGFDAAESFVPGSTYKVIDAQTETMVFEGAITLFNNGVTDAVSGDKIWWFDFSELTTPGLYYVFDEANNAKSYNFRIANNVYNEVLKQAVRTFFYQRAGFAKSLPYAEADWVDAASHIGNLQDKNCRLYNNKDDASTERDLHGGWYDAGDYNKYTAWTCNYIESMMLAYLENPEIWTDDYNIPESGNKIPDLLDEAKWGLDWVLRMQEDNGSVLCVMGLGHASPPSSAKEQSLYGPATSIATWSTAKACAIAAKVYAQIGMTDYAAQLEIAALKAWEWAEENPYVIFHNNNKIAAGDQEIETFDAGEPLGVENDYRRLSVRLNAALYLYEMTGEKQYLTLFEEKYSKLPLFMWNSFVSQYWMDDQQMFLYYLSLEGTNAAVKSDVEKALKAGFSSSSNYVGKIGKDGYRSFIEDYNWGSNKYKSDYGLTLYLLAEKSLISGKDELLRNAAEDYVHYIHGVNPFAWVYLSNMKKYGASKCISEFYHSWFGHGTNWGKNPAPGFLPGGPNASYEWDGCCSGNCGSAANNAICSSETLPVGEPAAKMYKDFNTSWPLNSWSLTENSCGYQLAYIRLLSRFVANPSENTGFQAQQTAKNVEVYPNPAKDVLNIRSNELIQKIEIFDAQMHLLGQQTANSSLVQMNVSSLISGVYFLRIQTAQQQYMKRVIITK